MAAIGCSKALFVALLVAGLFCFLCSLHWATSGQSRHLVLSHSASTTRGANGPQQVISEVTGSRTFVHPSTRPPVVAHSNTSVIIVNVAPGTEYRQPPGEDIVRPRFVNASLLHSLTLKPKRINTWCSEQNIADFTATVSDQKPLSLLLEPGDMARYNDENTFLIYVYSAPGNFWRRHTIRHTWGDSHNYRNASTGFKVKVVFVLGLRAPLGWWDEAGAMDLVHVARESCLYNDILMINLEDSYYNLTLKGLAAMYWVRNTAPRVKFVFKTDDDVMLNVFAWMRDARLMERDKCAVCIRGLVFPTSAPFREGKWGVSYDEFPDIVYPPFCSGTGYLLTGRAVDAVLKASLEVPLFKLEDVYFTGLVREKAGIEAQDAGMDYYWLFENDPKPLWPESEFRVVTSEAYNVRRWEYFWQQLVEYEGRRNVITWGRAPRVAMEMTPATPLPGLSQSKQSVRIQTNDASSSASAGKIPAHEVNTYISPEERRWGLPVKPGWDVNPDMPPADRQASNVNPHMYPAEQQARPSEVNHYMPPAEKRASASEVKPKMPPGDIPSRLDKVRQPASDIEPYISHDKEKARIPKQPSSKINPYILSDERLKQSQMLNQPPPDISPIETAKGYERNHDGDLRNDKAKVLSIKPHSPGVTTHLDPDAPRLSPDLTRRKSRFEDNSLVSERKEENRPEGRSNKIDEKYDHQSRTS